MKRGDIYYANLGNSFGCEQGGRRPALIIQNDIGNKHSPTTIIAPITSWKKNMPTHIEIGKAERIDPKSVILLEQIRIVDKKRLDNFVCSLGKDVMKEVDKAIEISLGINSEMKEESNGEKMDLAVASAPSILVFSSNEFGNIRTILKDGEPWLVAKDVAVALGYKNARDAVETHVEEEDKGVAKCDTPGGAQNLAIINESGMYSLIFGSKLSSAKSFKKWVTSEVLPQIRRAGFYRPERMEPEEIMRIQLGMIDKHEERIANLEATMNVGYEQQRIIERALKDRVAEILGGKYSKAYRQISKKIFSEFNRDVKDKFGVTSRNNIPRIRFNESLEYIHEWKPCEETLELIKETA